MTLRAARLHPLPSGSVPDAPKRSFFRDLLHVLADIGLVAIGLLSFAVLAMAVGSVVLILYFGLNLT